MISIEIGNVNQRRIALLRTCPTGSTLWWQQALSSTMVPALRIPGFVGFDGTHRGPETRAAEN